MLSGNETRLNANLPRRHFRKGFHRTALQNIPCIWTWTKTANIIITHWVTFSCRDSPRNHPRSDAPENNSIWTLLKRKFKHPTCWRQAYCKNFNSNTRGSDAQWEGNTAECKLALQALLERVSPKGTTKRPKHLNLNQNRKSHHNTLNNFQLQRFIKKLYVFRCTGKQQHLNSAKTQIQAPNTLITSILQEFQQQYPRFRCSGKAKYR